VKKIAIGVAGFLALAILAVLLLRSSDEVKIEKTLRECADAAERGDPEGIIRHLDPACTLGESDHAAFCARIRREIGQVRGTRIELGIAATVDRDEATVSLEVGVRAAMRDLGRSGYGLKMRRFDGEWRITRVDEVR
jgi:hypothetical protein